MHVGPSRMCATVRDDQETPIESQRPGQHRGLDRRRQRITESAHRDRGRPVPRRRHPADGRPQHLTDPRAVPRPRRGADRRRRASSVAGHVAATRFGSGHNRVTLTKVQPTVIAEITADAARQHGVWRHPLRFLRTRPDVTVHDLPILETHIDDTGRRPQQTYWGAADAKSPDRRNGPILTDRTSGPRAFSPDAVGSRSSRHPRPTTCTPAGRSPPPP